MTCELCNKKIHASGLCTIHWRYKKYGQCVNKCFQPANGNSGLCGNCIKRGGIPPASRHNGVCSTCSLPLIDFRCSTCDTDRKRNEHLIRKYKMPLAAWREILSSQSNLCKICERDSKRFVVDHDHSCCPGQRTCGECVRGIICENCNRALGLIKDSKIILQKMIDYLSD
jgi:hypothetical protein